jgi:replicative DNA helicase
MFDAPDYPHSTEAEEAIAGSVLIDPYLYRELSQVVSADDFYIHRLRFVWQSYERLIKRSLPIDTVTVCEELDDMGRLEEIGGPAFLTALLNQVPTTLHAEGYARIIRKLSQKRKLLKIFGYGAELSHNGKEPIDIIEHIQAELTREAVNSSTESAITSTGDALREAMDTAEKASRGEIRNIKSGLADMDRYFKIGFQEQKLVIIAGRPGDGKSALQDTIAVNSINQQEPESGRHIAVFTMEMPASERVNRYISQIAKIPLDRVESGKMSDDEQVRYYQAVGIIERAPIDFYEEPKYTIPGMENLLRRGILERGDYDAIIVDPLNMIDAQMQGAKRHEQIDAAAYGLKYIARKFRAPVICAHPMNRGAEEREAPILKDLENAGEKPADVILFIYTDTKDGEGVKRIKAGKNRGGPAGWHEKFSFLGQFTRFENLYGGNK